jgi:hypothetical protein
MKEPGLDDRHRDKNPPKAGEIQQKRSDTLNKNLPKPIPEFSPLARKLGKSTLSQLVEPRKRDSVFALVGCHTFYDGPNRQRNRVGHCPSVLIP